MHGESTPKPDRGEAAQAILGALLAFLAVAIGAFTTHALRSRIGPEEIELMRLGSRYQMFHALALLWITVAAHRWPDRAMRFAGWAFAGGIVLFSGTLYAIALTGARWLGAITPVGGLALLAGWLAVAWGVWRSSRP